MTRDPFWVWLISDDRLLDIAELVAGQNIALLASHYLSKPPVEGMSMLWRQDGSIAQRAPGCWSRWKVNKYHPRPRCVEGEHVPFRGCEA